MISTWFMSYVVWPSVLLKQQNIMGKNMKFEGEYTFGFGVIT